MNLTIKNHLTLDELNKEIRESKDGKYQTRLRTIILATKGLPRKDILQNILISKNTYYHWIHTYNDGGVKALKDIKTTGRINGNPKYKNEIFIKLFNELDSMKEYWSIIKMQKFIKDEYKIDIPNETLRMRVKRAGYSYKSNRPSPYKGDKEKQESFKKTLSRMWLKH